MSLPRLQIFKSCFQSDHGSVATEVTTEGTPSLGPEASYLPGKLYIQYKAFRDGLTNLTLEEIDVINEIEMFNCLFYKKYFDEDAPKNLFVTYTLMKMFKNRPEQMDWRNFKTVACFLKSVEYADFVNDLRKSGYVARKCVERLSKLLSFSEYVSYARQDLIDEMERNLIQLEENFTSDVLKTIRGILATDIWWLLDSLESTPSILEIRQDIKDRACTIMEAKSRQDKDKPMSITSHGRELIKEMADQIKAKPTFITPEPGSIEDFAKDLVEARNRHTPTEYITPEEKQYIFDRNFLQWKAIEISRGTYMAPRPRFYSARGGAMGPYIWE